MISIPLTRLHLARGFIVKTIQSRRAIFGDGFPSANEAAFSLITIQRNKQFVYFLWLNFCNCRVIYCLHLNQWFYLSITFDSGNIKAFVDGSRNYINGSYNKRNPQLQPKFVFRIGKNQSAPLQRTSSFNGNMANVAIWNRALSSDEINSVMWKGYECFSYYRKKRTTGLV